MLCAALTLLLLPLLLLLLLLVLVPVHLHHPCTSSGLPATKKQVLLLTYDLAKKLPAQVAARFGVVICDESHHLKNKDAERTKCMRALVTRTKRAMLLTGTPLLSRPIEAWSQVNRTA
jgi:SWI/SNF-related matrix-associated actin-dependent regulator 1 of chromatin subfamily A